MTLWHGHLGLDGFTFNHSKKIQKYRWNWHWTDYEAFFWGGDMTVSAPVSQSVQFASKTELTKLYTEYSNNCFDIPRWTKTRRWTEAKMETDKRTRGVSYFLSDRFYSTHSTHHRMFSTDIPEVKIRVKALCSNCSERTQAMFLHLHTLQLVPVQTRVKMETHWSKKNVTV